LLYGSGYLRETKHNLLIKMENGKYVCVGTVDLRTNERLALTPEKIAICESLGLKYAI